MSLTKSKYGAIGAMAAQSDSSGTAGYSLFAGQPRGLSTLFFAELWERFSYYGMRALLTLFIVAPLTTGGLGLTTVEAARIYGNYTMAVYLLSIPGGYIADRYLGAHYRRADRRHHHRLRALHAGGAGGDIVLRRAGRSSRSARVCSSRTSAPWSAASTRPAMSAATPASRSSTWASTSAAFSPRW